MIIPIAYVAVQRLIHQQTDRLGAGPVGLGGRHPSGQPDEARRPHVGVNPAGPILQHGEDDLGSFGRHHPTGDGDQSRREVAAPARVRLAPKGRGERPTRRGRRPRPPGRPPSDLPGAPAVGRPSPNLWFRHLLHHRGQPSRNIAAQPRRLGGLRPGRDDRQGGRVSCIGRTSSGRASARAAGPHTSAAPAVPSGFATATSPVARASGPPCSESRLSFVLTRRCPAPRTPVSDPRRTSGPRGRRSRQRPPHPSGPRPQTIPSPTRSWRRHPALGPSSPRSTRHPRPVPSWPRPSRRQGPGSHPGASRHPCSGSSGTGRRPCSGFR